jgi:hypothetical protein
MLLCNGARDAMRSRTMEEDAMRWRRMLCGGGERTRCCAVEGGGGKTHLQVLLHTHINTHTHAKFRRTWTSWETWTMTTLASTASTRCRAPRITTCRNPALVVLDTERAGESMGARARAQVGSWHKSSGVMALASVVMSQGLCDEALKLCDLASRRASRSKVKHCHLVSRRPSHLCFKASFQALSPCLPPRCLLHVLTATFGHATATCAQTLNPRRVPKP